MFPKEIIEILEKYQSDNTEILDDINLSISTIKCALREINNIIAEKTHTLMVEDNANDDNITELFKESKILKDYIKSIQFVSTWKTNSKNKDCEISKELSVPTFSKNVCLHLVSDNLCPFCNMTLTPHTVYYQRILNNKLCDENIEQYKCPSCGKLFALDCDLDGFDFENTNITLNKSKYSTIPEIDIYSLIVLSNTLKCSSNHNTRDILAKIPILDEKGNIFYVARNASYCPICNRFTMLKDDFDRINGVVTCKVIDETQHNNNNSYDSDFDSEQSKSVLTQYGYNVQTKNSISKEQRQIILASIIEAQIMSRREIMNHISTLIERGSKIESWRLATQKWKEDREYVASYNGGSLPEVIFDKIILKYNK